VVAQGPGDTSQLQRQAQVRWLAGWCWAGAPWPSRPVDCHAGVYRRHCTCARRKSSGLPSRGRQPPCRPLCAQEAREAAAAAQAEKDRLAQEAALMKEVGEGKAQLHTL
jgi:hypothetical protein